MTLRTQRLHSVLVVRPQAIVVDAASCILKPVDEGVNIYFERNYGDFVTRNYLSESFKDIASALRQDANLDHTYTRGHTDLIPDDTTQMLDYVTGFVGHCLVSNKWPDSIQALRIALWYDGYRNGDLDKPLDTGNHERLFDWRDDHFQLGLLSTNEEPLLVLRYSVNQSVGDVLSLENALNHYFDNNLGHFDRPLSFQNIATRFQLPARTILYVTSCLESARAARESLFNVVLIVQDLVPDDLPEIDDFKVAKSLTEIEFSAAL